MVKLVVAQGVLKELGDVKRYPAKVFRQITLKIFGPLSLNVAVAHARGKSPRSVLFQHFSERSQPFGGLNNWRGTDER